MKIFKIILLNLIFFKIVFCQEWVNFVGYSNQNCSGTGILAIMKTNECIGHSKYMCDEKTTINKQYAYNDCVKEYNYKTNENNQCSDKGFTTSCTKTVNLPKMSYIIAMHKNTSLGCSDESIILYNTIPLGICDSGKIYTSCNSGGTVSFEIYKDYECNELTNTVEEPIGCHFVDSSDSYLINTFCT
ncbi:hypothetical protein DICPUDRAFT_154701 [Dictyostelium purpureum]|uniref:SUEL-type lectin domain-containing protein n=1 Tax=Dictyostelium purpureum TaxID=5786 RepID=F0ZS15_DICPU|nr:uncharacterized protein DICPUDRAFT_154701 [Dictyostelium purpureum]EGC33257.1 hypothetical protein DICPUDRAFT_154701 [Dictyostelium purpureum]|eukprot:XP_003290204.1 hypothetical protein DICPUDRAFT_154701 [Dictyostelium purpureum]